MSKALFVCAMVVSTFVMGLQQTHGQQHVIVPGYERFRSQHLSAEQAGGLLLSELNCRSCHQTAVSSTLNPRSAPILTNVSSRVSVDFLRKFIADPQSVKPGTAMPHVVSGADSTQNVEALVHFLASGGVAVESPVSADAVERGENLFHTVGCAACHGDQRMAAADRPEFVMPLGPVDRKYTVASLVGFLSNPHAVRPSGRMPSLNLTAEESRDIASYLLRDIDVAPNINVAIYEGNWQALPDFDSLTPKTTVGVTSFDVRVASRRDQFGLRFEGFVHLPADGEYRFFLGSDDGSRLLIDGEVVVDCDGIHPHSTQEGRSRLTAGAHKVVVEYFEGGGEESLAVEVEGAGLAKQTLAGLMSLTDTPPEQRRGFQPDEQLVAKGRELFASLGCASCHSHGDGDNRVASRLQAPALATGNAQGGCLAADTNSPAPRFALSDVQRHDITAALQQPADNSEAGGQLVSEVMLTLNCYACHQRGEIGGVPRELETLFSGNIPEMGDEGRIPPHLDGVGDKLNAAWLTHVMNEGAKDRPYMLTRMPRFGSANVGPLVPQLSELDARDDVEPVTFEEASHRVEADARLMVGDQALSCIKCHTFDKHKATGIQSLDMTTMTKRLRRDWFHRYLLNPQAFRPGTRMPAAWPNGRSVVPHILHGNSSQQIEAIWQYLGAGASAKVPSGLVVNAIELKPVDRPIIYRNFIEGLSPRGIAVGYPEKAHIAWDAQQMNLRLIWHGAFIDASKHWVGRGPGFQGPLGDHVMRLTSGAPLAILPDLEAKWPGESARDLGFRFRGYSLNPAGQPTFQYAWKGIQVSDFIQPEATDQDAALIRTLELQSSEPVAGLYLRVAADDRIEATSGGWRIGDAIEVVTMDGTATVRDHDGKQELLIPVGFDASGTAVVRYKLIW